MGEGGKYQVYQMNYHQFVYIYKSHKILFLIQQKLSIPLFVKKNHNRRNQNKIQSSWSIHQFLVSSLSW